MWVHVIIVGVTVLDQLTKLLVQSLFDVHDSITVIPSFFSLSYVQNEGAAWGIFSGHRWPLIAVSVAMLAFLVHARKQFLSEGTMARAGYGLMCAGIIGNLVDRVRQGYVIDFLDFQFGAWHFPSFNVADSAICIGVGLFFVRQFMQYMSARKNGSNPQPAV